jgi:hypothetical protein
LRVLVENALVVRLQLMKERVVLQPLHDVHQELQPLDGGDADLRI